MQYHKILFVSALTTMLLVIGTGRAGNKSDQTYEQLWEQARQLNEKQLPQSALLVVNRLYEKAVAEGNQQQMLHALIFGFGLRKSFEDDVFKNALAQTRQLSLKAGFPVKEIAHSLLAEMYWFHYQENRHRILDRSAAGNFSSDDPDEWDALRYRDEILHHYQQSLRNQAQLEGISLKEWALLLEDSESSSLELQPTLFDFLAGRYLNYLAQADAALQSRLPLSEALPGAIWQAATLFATLDLPRQDHETLLRLRLMQRILTSNIRMGHTFSLIHNELQRFRWLSALTGDNQSYYKALIQLRKQYAANPASAEVAADLAELLRSSGPLTDVNMPLAEALRICDQAIDQFPDTRGAQRCKAIRGEILQKSLSVTVQRTEYPGKPIAAHLSYRNLTNPSFRIARVSSRQLAEINQDFDHKRRVQALLDLRPLNQWELELPFEPDYAGHSTIIALPALKPGLYVILASDNPSFDAKGLISFTSFQVSSMSFMQINRKGTNHFVLLERYSGKPVGGAKVSVSVREYNYTVQKTVENIVLEFVTPKNGEFSIGPDHPKLPRNRSFFIKVVRDGDTLMSDNYFDIYRITEPQRTQYKTWLFTDRAIYRPGQVVYFKGITLVKDPGIPWKAENGNRTEIRLFDVNGREISSVALMTNDFGSFEGSFVLPATLLTGNMRLSNEHGMAFVQVEEYKRPTFEINLKLPEHQLMLGDTIRMKGIARAFAGFPIDGAKVEFRVERQQHLPWIPWWRPFPVSEVKQLIKQGNAITASDGSFELSFPALPDYSELQNEEKYFDFRLTAWVTDRNGEVRQASTSLLIGNRSLMLGGEWPESINRNEAGRFQISLSTTQGQPAAAQTTFTFYRLDQRQSIARPAIFGLPDRKLLDNAALKSLFPHDDFYASSVTDSLPKSLVMNYTSFVNGSAPAFPEALSQWPEGDYLAEFQSTDQSGRTVKLQHRFTLYNPASQRNLPDRLFWVKPIEKEAKPGDTIELLVSSSLRGMRILMEISSDDKILQRRWLKLGQRKQNVKLILTSEHIGSLSVQFTGVALNRHFHKVFDMRVADPEQKLDLRLETIVERLQPGRQEEWTIRISRGNKQAVPAELLAAMYDASLEQFKSHRWLFNPIPDKPFAQRWMSDNGFGTFTTWPINLPLSEPVFISNLQPPVINWYDFLIRQVWHDLMRPMSAKGLMRAGDPVVADMGRILEVGGDQPNQNEQVDSEGTTVAARNLRSDFRETAFFYPQMRSDSSGRVSFRFTTPDALTRWRLMLLAHTTDLKYATNTFDFEASKPLLVVPNLARFYRLGDTAVIYCKVVNTGTSVLDGMAMLEAADALTGEAVGQVKDAARKPFVQLRPGQSTEVRWIVVMNTTAPLLRLRISASAGTFTDAEEHLVPLLPSGIRLTETLPMFVKGNSTGVFMLPGLEKPSPAESTLNLKLDVTTHPAWVAVKALPYMVDAGFENSDNAFRRFYTNTLASHVATSIPHFDAVLKAWNASGSDALQSELHKHQDVKPTALEQTPWLAEAESEQAQRQRLILFFDKNRISSEQEQSLTKLAQMQLPDGSWPWFPGMRGNLWITLSILEGFGKLTEIKPELNSNPVVGRMLQNALTYIDRQAAELYSKRTDKESAASNHLQLLSARSYFFQFEKTDEATLAYNYFDALVSRDWNKFGIGDQGRLALYYRRTGKKDLAVRIAASLAERAVRSEKLGVWWKAARTDHQALSVETHAQLVHVFELVAADRPMADGIRQYLLSQKQTRRWTSGPATAEAVYALLMVGSNWTAAGSPVKVMVGNKPLVISDQEAGTGQFSTFWNHDITPAMARVEITNPNIGPIWGGVFRQFEVPVDAVRPSASDVKLSREIMVERTSASGIMIEPWRKQNLRPGDRIRIRLVLETDRDLEFVHLSDLRSPAFEPSDVLSGYQWRNGLGYYQSTRNASTDFFFDFLPRGKHVFEYGLVVMQTGQFSGGFARMQSYYAPAFSTHSAGTRIRVD